MLYSLYLFSAHRTFHNPRLLQVLSNLDLTQLVWNAKKRLLGWEWGVYNYIPMGIPIYIIYIIYYPILYSSGDWFFFYTVVILKLFYSYWSRIGFGSFKRRSCGRWRSGEFRMKHEERDSKTSKSKKWEKKRRIITCVPSSRTKVSPLQHLSHV